jgi:hypothetical protein
LARERARRDNARLVVHDDNGEVEHAEAFTPESLRTVE